jgi:hypothetical protein
MAICLVVCGVAGCEVPAAKTEGSSTILFQAAGSEADSNAKPREDGREYRTESIPGRVVWMAEALARRYGVTSVPEAQERILAIETVDGNVLPIVEDLRGRSFRADERLRAMDVELLVRRYDAVPMIQILKIHEIKDGKKYVIDYWCDICSIVMFETGPCACCQDDNRLRKRLVDE